LLRVGAQRPQARQSIAWCAHGVVGQLSPRNPIRAIILTDVLSFGLASLGEKQL
jgi:hypothetical protein